MGNKNNQLIQCGFDGKAVEGEAHTTREEAMADNGRPDKSVIDRNTKLFASGQNSDISSHPSSHPSIKPLRSPCSPSNEQSVKATS